MPALATYVTGPEPGGIDPAVVLTNLFLTLLLVFLFALTAEIFNSTMDAHRDEVHGWWLRIAGGPFGILNRLTVPGASLTRLAGTGRFGSIARVLLVLFLLGFVYSALSPDFGFNTQTVTLFVSLVVALGFLTYFTEGSTTPAGAPALSRERLGPAVRHGRHRVDHRGRRVAPRRVPARARLRVHRVGGDRHARRARAAG